MTPEQIEERLQGNRNRSALVKQIRFLRKELKDYQVRELGLSLVGQWKLFSK